MTFTGTFPLTTALETARAGAPQRGRSTGLPVGPRALSLLTGTALAVVVLCGLSTGAARAQESVSVDLGVLDDLDRHLTRSRLLFPEPTAPKSRLILKPPSERADPMEPDADTASERGVLAPVHLRPPPGMSTVPVLIPPVAKPAALPTQRPAEAPPADITAAPVPHVSEPDSLPPPEDDLADIDMSDVPDPLPEEDPATVDDMEPEVAALPEPEPEPVFEDVPEPEPEPLYEDVAEPEEYAAPEPLPQPEPLPEPEPEPEPALDPEPAPEPEVAAPQPAPEPVIAARPAPPPEQEASLPAPDAPIVPPRGDGPFDPNQPVSVPYTPGARAVPPEAGRDLAALAAYMKRDPLPTLRLRAYASAEDGETSTARRLSLSRAIAVRAYLVDQGVDGTRIEVLALGNQYAAGTRPDRVDATLVTDE